MMLTPEDAARNWLCPFAITFSQSPAVPGCRGPECALWRWELITTTHPLWKDAVKNKAAELGERVPFQKASAWVAENMEALGLIPTKGFCGAGGAS